uniref:Major facilitator superfamily (MFS) profile domain-containing protein n=1 Tax=Moniliophthora roreri TaxID=221103 RepID=A0A0W0FIR5_MONRR
MWVDWSSLSRLRFLYGAQRSPSLSLNIGQRINYLSGGRLLSYADQRPGYRVPQRYLSSTLSRASTATIKVTAQQKKITSAYPSSTLPGGEAQAVQVEQKVDEEEADKRTQVVEYSDGTKAGPTDYQGASQVGIKEAEIESVIDPFLVDWDGSEDPDNPNFFDPDVLLKYRYRNWSPFKKSFVVFSIALLTFSVYIGSAIYTSSIPGLMSEFGIPQVIGSLGLTLYVLAYGIGPMFLTPLQELPSLGRNPVYIFGLILFLFLTGFVGSPALATGGASMADIFEGHRQSYMIGIWSLGAVAGPILGPVIGGFAAQAKDWRWPIYELMWISALAILFLSFLLPETYEATILRKRAQRLRKLTGNT